MCGRARIFAGFPSPAAGAVVTVQTADEVAYTLSLTEQVRAEISLPEAAEATSKREP
jgi:hypothetical protein